MRPRPLRLAVRCPACFQEPAVRIFPGQLEIYADRDPDEPVMSVQCPRCRTKYIIRVEAYHGAA